MSDPDQQADELVRGERARPRRGCCSIPAAFVEFIGPEQREISPHLRLFDLPEQFDDGIVVGRGRLDGHRRCSSPRRRAASWAAPSARCTAPS